MKKFALFVFNGDPMCFVHVLLNALDMDAEGHEVRLIVEGAATALLPELEKAEHPLHKLWKRTLNAELVHGVCLACATKMGTADTARQLGVSLLDEMNGHPSMAAQRKDGFELVTF
jgi:hypothetical protein